MRRPVIALLASAAWLGSTAPPPAHAEPIGARPFVAGLPAYEILTIIRSTGFEPVGRPVRRPGVYLVRAVDPYDRGVDLTVDARTGRILMVKRAAPGTATPMYGPLAPAYGPPAPRYGAYGPPRPYLYGPPGSGLDDSAGFEDATGALPLPPRSIPARKSAAPKPSRSASVLPIPRPRPVQSAPAPQVAPPPAPAAHPAAAQPPKPDGAPDMPPVTPLE